MDNLNRKFEETYGEIISESFGKAITNFAKLKWTDKAKNKELKKTLDKVLTSYGFSNLDGDNDEDENLSDWSKVEIWNKKDGTKKYIKIIISNAIFKESGDIQYSIRAINAISGKKIGVPGHNFILKPRYTENDMVKVINECLKPIVLTHEDHRVEAKEAKNPSKKEDVKQTAEGNNASPESKTPESKSVVNLSPEVIKKAKNGLRMMGKDTIEALSNQYPEFESMVNKIRNEG